MDTLQQLVCRHTCASAGLPPDRGIQHVTPFAPDAQPVPQRMSRLAHVAFQDHVCYSIRNSIYRILTGGLETPVLHRNVYLDRTYHLPWECMCGLPD